ncbi:MAG: tetratricopeptide repeat protein [Nitrospirota bacterium]
MRKYIIFIFLSVLLYACASTLSEERRQEASAHYQLGVSYLNDNNIQPAFVEFQKALDMNPHDTNVHNAIGVIYLEKLEDYPMAINHFKEALRIDQNFSEASNNLGNAYAKTGEYDKAIEFYKKATSNPLYPNAALALNNLAMVYYRLSKYDEAISTFKEALKRHSDFHQPYYGLALSYNAKGQYGDASLAISRAIELDPFYRNDREKAIKDLKDRKLRARGAEEKDIIDYLEILNY